ncbi:hypothetical protein ATANTOWER_032620 [Ataeniobius toweri]|uniref:Uncharacterized protein n=1 Tax=Ataeniobius toweri TaxID=208326 RepID=A0ABU7BLL9_9TELE|nr:hypothetical protein [Ataeniobius toweri]
MAAQLTQVCVCLRANLHMCDICVYDSCEVPDLHISSHTLQSSSPSQTNPQTRRSFSWDLNVEHGYKNKKQIQQANITNKTKTGLINHLTSYVLVLCAPLLTHTILPSSSRP